MYKLLARKAQVFYLDLFIAILIIVAASIFFFQSEANIIEEAPQRVNDLFIDADSIADSLMSPGVPKNWNNPSVIAIGLVDDFRINITKLYNFQGMVQDDYSSVRQKLQTPYDFFISFADKDGIIKINNTQGIGKPGVNSTNVHEIENPADLIVINRLVIYNSNPARMVLYLWN